MAKYQPTVTDELDEDVASFGDMERDQQAASLWTLPDTAEDPFRLFHPSASEDASSTGRPYSPSAASSIGTRLAPSLFSLEIDSRTILGGQRPTTRLSQSPIRAAYSNIRKAILNGPNETRSEAWCVPVRLVAGTKDVNAWETVAALDSHCMYNLVSTRAVEKQFLAIERTDPSHFANTITGQPIYCFGYIDMRLDCKVRIKSILGRDPTFQQRYYDIRFLVVESDGFEVIIGHQTMEKENIYRDKDIIF